MRESGERPGVEVGWGEGKRNRQIPKVRESGEAGIEKGVDRGVKAQIIDQEC